MPGSPATGPRPKTTPRSFGLTRLRQERAKNNAKYSAASADPNYQVGPPLPLSIPMPCRKLINLYMCLIAVRQVSSFRDIPFESEEMKRLLDMNTPDYIEKKGNPSQGPVLCCVLSFLLALRLTPYCRAQVPP